MRRDGGYLLSEPLNACSKQAAGRGVKHIAMAVHEAAGIHTDDGSRPRSNKSSRAFRLHAFKVVRLACYRKCPLAADMLIHQILAIERRVVFGARLHDLAAKTFHGGIW